MHRTMLLALAFTQLGAQQSIQTPSSEATKIDSKTISSESQVSNTRRMSTMQPEPWPEASNFVEAKTLPLDLNAFYPETGGYESTAALGRRVFGFRLQPGEKLEFNMKSEDNKVAMRAHVSDKEKSLKWQCELQAANKVFRAKRSNHFEVKNPTTENQSLYLILYGVTGYSYRVETVRTKPN